MVTAGARPRQDLPAQYLLIISKYKISLGDKFDLLTLKTVRYRSNGAVAYGCLYTEKEILHIRHHSLFTPRDFDLSPYFKIVKPSLQQGFDYKNLNWADEASGVGL